jgi:hypothetical protein
MHVFNLFRMHESQLPFEIMFILKKKKKKTARKI